MEDVIIVFIIIATLILGAIINKATKRKWGENPSGIGHIFKGDKK